MSSATSIKGRQDVRELEGAPGVGDEAGGRASADGFRPIHFFVLASLIAATAAVVVSRDPSPAHLILISLTIAAAGLAATGVYRMLAPLVAPDMEAFREPLSERARAATEREKALVLRSLKELEFDKAMGKLSDRDFDEMAGRLRARAVALMKQLQESEGGYRVMVERDLKARLATPPPVPAPAVPAPAAPAAHTCAACDTRNDPDAAFCKRCGASLG
jgi:hypothetical protein